MDATSPARAASAEGPATVPPCGIEDGAIAVAIVNYGSADLVIEALPALLAECRGLRRAAVVVVDNASPGDDADRLARHIASLGPDEPVRLVRSPTNGGFAAGNNLAFAACRELGWRPDGVMLLNPDAAVTGATLRPLLRLLRDEPRAGIVGASLVNDDGTRRPAAFAFPTAMHEFARTAGIGPLSRLWATAAPVGETPTRVDWVTGAAALIRTDVIEALGPMDEGYFLYFEETDYMRRATLAGWEVWTVPQALVTHRAGASTGIVGGRPRQGRMPAYWFRSWRRYFLKNHGRPGLAAAAALRLLGMGLGTVVARLRGRPDPFPERFIADFTRICVLGRP